MSFMFIFAYNYENKMRLQGVPEVSAIVLDASFKTRHSPRTSTASGISS